MTRRTCLLFGATGDIGKAILDLFVRDGYYVVCAARSEVNLQGLRHKFGDVVGVHESDADGHRDWTRDDGEDMLCIPCDITKAEQVQNVVKKTLDKMGHVDVLVNSAGINADGLLLRASEEEMINLVNTNLVGSMLTCKSVLRSMMQKKQGSIINIGSAVGTIGNIGQTVYGASKAGLVGFTRSLAKEVASRGITANVVSPGFIKGDMVRAMDTNKRDHAKDWIPVGRMGDPTEVAQLVRFLVDARYITGQVIHIDGGLSMC